MNEGADREPQGEGRSAWVARQGRALKPWSRLKKGFKRVSRRRLPVTLLLHRR
jgi:hypothetical protein